mmetsp:Transcript_93100/g.207119  ORF Transcript_93100/g.207119 Transcript_93100/m.207119 type:complete len:209 (+) Transcript_93100:52-678(+)
MSVAGEGSPGRCRFGNPCSLRSWLCTIAPVPCRPAAAFGAGCLQAPAPVRLTTLTAPATFEGGAAFPAEVMATVLPAHFAIFPFFGAAAITRGAGLFFASELTLTTAEAGGDLRTFASLIVATAAAAALGGAQGCDVQPRHAGISALAAVAPGGHCRDMPPFTAVAMGLLLRSVGIEAHFALGIVKPGSAVASAASEATALPAVLGVH